MTLADRSDLSTWEKAHNAYLEVQVHLVHLLVRRRIEATHHHHGEVGVDEERTDVPDLAKSIATHRARLEELQRELEDIGGPDNVTSLVVAAGLTEPERLAVVAALCGELDPALAEQYAYLNGDPGRRYATPQLVAAINDLPAADEWSLLDPGGPLLRFRILELGASGAAGALRIDRRMMGYLRGRNRIDERLRPILSALDVVAVSSSILDVVDSTSRWLADSERSSGRVVVDLVGSSADTRSACAAHLIRKLGLHPMRLHLNRILPLTERHDLLRLVEREAILLQAGTYVDVGAGWGEDTAGAAAAQELIDDLDGLVVVGSDQRVELEGEAHVVPVPSLTSADRIALWVEALGRTIPGLERVVEQFALGPTGIVRAAREAEVIAELSGDDGINAQSAWLACRRLAGRDMGRMARKLEPAATWEDLVLPEEQVTVLQAMAGQVANRNVVYDKWRFGANLTRGRGISALFTGPPGTGKTMAAEIIAAHLDLDLYRIDLASVVSKYIGETEKNLRGVFDAAERGGSILFFDEADALFSKRTEVKDSHDRYANIETNYLLQRMEEYPGLAILATNRKADLDPAFLRRIRFLVAFPHPNPDARLLIWKTVIPEEAPRGSIDFEALARLDLAGGNIKNIAVNGAFLAAAAGEPITTRHLMTAARHEYRKIDKLPSRADFGDYYEMVTS
jgi:hypothetical protein